MKDSGVEWIGEIPENWELPKVKNLFDIGRGRVISQLDLEDSGYPVYSSQTKNNGCLGYIRTYDFDRSQLTWTTDGANAGTVFLREGKHNCTNVCGTLMPKNENNNLRYMKYALEYIAIFHKRADTNGYKIMNNEMAEIKITLPPRFVQDIIADFLDEKVGEIDFVIARTKETIEDYKKYKQAIITDAVTKGLNPDVEIKDSGIEWIGSIPEHWKVKKIKYILCESGERTKTGLEEPLSMSQKRGLIPTKEMDVIPNVASSFDNCKIVHKNDLVFNKLKAHLGVFAKSDYDGLVSPDYAVYQPKAGDNMLFVQYLFKTPQCISQFIKYSRGVAQGLTRLYTEEFFSISVAIPTRQEQDIIAQYIFNKCSKIDKLIAKKEELLADLEDYKKSLIYEYVTGKKEVE